MPSVSHQDHVYINCPFDGEYQPLFEALVFAVHDCGFIARSALELEDGSQVRIDKVERLIAACRLGIHDISRMELDAPWGLPRFNMPLELGFFLGAKRFGTGDQRRKVCLILDRELNRYQKFCSNIAGQDIKAHNGDPRDVVRLVRDWLRSASSGAILPSGAVMVQRFEEFLRKLPEICDELRLDRGDLIYRDYTAVAAAWIARNPW
ncbi:hypothetical protein [Longimicrobium sp.]|uniref:hypothetical protein n=1 Tax=Longimicrobium sp. TaxID=2029185 RepID=UPI003B3ACB49